MLEKYFQYLKDNPSKYWFKAKLYGWGWVPVRWQGWMVIGAFIAFIIWSGTGLDGNAEPNARQLAWFLIKIALAVAVLMVICFKTGEKPKWQWGPSKDKR